MTVTIDHVETLRSPSSLIYAPVPCLRGEQLSQFTPDGLQSTKYGKFDPHGALRQLHDKEGIRIMTIDIGGTKLAATQYEVRDGFLREISPEESGYVNELFSRDGVGYRQALEEVAHYAQEQGLRVGISIASRTEGTKLSGISSNFPIFAEEMHQQYNGDLAQLFGSSVFVANDGVVALMAGSVVAVRINPEIKDAVLAINGTGLGGSVLSNGTIYSNEPGHTPIIDALNPFGVEVPGINGSKHATFQEVGASGFGIRHIFGSEVDGRAISCRYQSGNSEAFRFYEKSAYLTAHAIIGMAQAHEESGGISVFDSSKPGQSAILLHGGIFKVPGYPERVEQIVAQHLGFKPTTVVTHEVAASRGQNACLDGAAIGALLQ